MNNDQTFAILFRDSDFRGLGKVGGNRFFQNSPIQNSPEKYENERKNSSIQNSPKNNPN